MNVIKIKMEDLLKLIEKNIIERSLLYECDNHKIDNIIFKYNEKYYTISFFERLPKDIKMTKEQSIKQVNPVDKKGFVECFEVHKASVPVVMWKVLEGRTYLEDFKEKHKDGYCCVPEPWSDIPDGTCPGDVYDGAPLCNSKTCIQDCECCWRIEVKE